jgi:hypothetical protein
MRRAAFAIAALVASCHPAPARHVNRRAVDREMFYCFYGRTADEGLLACSDTAATCVRARDLALKWGGHAGVEQVGDCHELEVTPDLAP